MSRSLVSLVYTKFEQGPFSFIELLFYAVGLFTFPFILSFHLGSSICNEAEQGALLFQEAAKVTVFTRKTKLL